MSTSTVVIVGVDDICDDFVLCQLPLQLGDGLICFKSNLSTSMVLCQLPLQLLYVLMKIILILFYVSFHCNYKVHNEIYITFGFMSTFIAVIGVNKVFDTFVLCQLPLQFLDVLIKF